MLVYTNTLLDVRTVRAHAARLGPPTFGELRPFGYRLRRGHRTRCLLGVPGAAHTDASAFHTAVSSQYLNPSTARICIGSDMLPIARPHGVGPQVSHG